MNFQAGKVGINDEIVSGLDKNIQGQVIQVGIDLFLFVKSLSGSLGIGHSGDDFFIDIYLPGQFPGIKDNGAGEARFFHGAGKV